MAGRRQVKPMAPARLQRKLIRVSGLDARTFLQGVLTQDVERLSSAPVLYAGLLTPQGKVIADMFLWDAGEGAVIIDAAASGGADLMRRLALYKLRAQVMIEDVSEARAIVVSDREFEDAVADPRLPGLGWRALTGAELAPAYAEPSVFIAHRVGLGVPDLAIDASPEEVFALEALFEELHGVDFQKGCFVGQENVSRMKRRATTRRKFCALVFDGAPPPFGAAIHAGDADLGSVRSGVEGKALALIRLDRALEAARRGLELQAGGKPVLLAAHDWLIMPSVG